MSYPPQGVVRLDTDAARSTKAFEEAIYRDLDWLGLRHDGTDRQINRAKRLIAVLDVSVVSTIYRVETQREMFAQLSV